MLYKLYLENIWENKTGIGPFPDQGTWPLSTKQTEDRLRRASGPVSYVAYRNWSFKSIVFVLGRFESFVRPRDRSQVDPDRSRGMVLD